MAMERLDDDFLAYWSGFHELTCDRFPSLTLPLFATASSQHDRCVHGGKQLDRSVLVAVASSRQQHDTAQLAAAMEAESSAALARDVLVPFPGQPTVGIISSDAHPRSGRPPPPNR